MAYSLRDVIDDIYIESKDSDSIFRNKKRYNMLRYGREGLQELNMTFATHLKGMNVEIPTSCRVYKPNGYESFVRAYLLDCDGNTIEIKRNQNIPDEVRHYLLQCNGSIVGGESETNCDELYDNCLVCNKNEKDYVSVPCECCSGSGKVLSEKSAKLVEALHKYADSWVKTKDTLDYFEFSSDLEGLSVVIEYLSNSVFDEDECLITVDASLKTALTYYIKFKLLEGGLETIQQSQYFRKMFKNIRDKELIRNNALTKFDIYSLFLKK